MTRHHMGALTSRIPLTVLVASSLLLEACASFKAYHGISTPEYTARPTTVAKFLRATSRSAQPPACLRSQRTPASGGKALMVATVPRGVGIQIDPLPAGMLVDPRGYVGITPCVLHLPRGGYRLTLRKRFHSPFVIYRFVNDTIDEDIVVRLPELPRLVALPYREIQGWFAVAFSSSLGGAFAYHGVSDRNGASLFIAALALFPAVAFGNALLRLYSMPDPHVLRHEQLRSQ